MKQRKYFIFVFLIIIPIQIFSIPAINSVTENSDPVGQYNKFELTINLTANYSNPYNPDTSTNGIDLWAIFTSPSGVTKRVNGFYIDTNQDGTGDSWKIRFATGEQGQWSYRVYVKDNSGQANSSLYTFTVTASSNKGFIRKSTINPRYFAYENGGSFWGIGHNNGWQDWQNVENPSMSTMVNYGENVLSFWSNTPWQNNPSVDRERMPMEYAGVGLGNFWQWNGYFIDKMLDHAEANGIKLIIGIWIHDNLKEGSWWNLEYKNLSDCPSFFDNAASWTQQQKYYRYIIARFGYSRALFMWDLLVEANLTLGWINKGAGVVETWLTNVKNYFNANDPFSHPTTASLSGGWDSWNSDNKWPNGWYITGVSQIHSYEWKNDMAKVPRVIANNTIYMWNILQQPNFIGEFGTDNSGNQPTDLHRASWAALCSGAALEPLLWCDGGSWKFMDTNMLNQQKYLSQFVADIDFENKIVEHKSVTVSGYYSYAVGSSDYAICWIFNDAGNIGTGKQLVLSTLEEANYHILWYNTWTGTTVSETDVNTSSGVLTVNIPAVSYADIACKITKNGPPPSPTNTGTATNTGTFTRTSTPTFTFTRTNTPGGPTDTYTQTPTFTFTPTNTTVIIDNAKYNFEDGTLQNWFLDTANAPQGVNVSNSTDYAIGIRSAKLQVNFIGGGSTWNQGAIAHSNQSPVGIVKAKVYVPSGVIAQLKAKIYLQDSSWVWRENTIIDLIPGTWTELTWDLSSVSYGNPVNKIGVMIGSYDNYNGFVYIDSIDYLEQGEPTRTFTATPVNTLTFTNTQTFTRTFTMTNTRTNTPSATNTQSFTPSVTASMTSSPSYSVTNTRTNTHTNTYTPTNSHSATISLTPTGTFTNTATATYTRTNSPSPTATASFTGTQTNTATHTFTPTETVTGSQPPTWTNTDTPTFTNTFTETRTNTITNTATQTFTPTDTNTLIFTLTDTATFIFTNTATQIPSSTITNTPTYTLTLTPSYTATFTFTGTPINTNTQTLSLTFTPTLANTATFVLTVIPTETENLEIINDSILFYPQPYSGKKDAYIKFKITKEAKEVSIKIYTVSFRFIKEARLKNQYVAGINEIKITEDIKNLANGIYYFVIIAADDKKYVLSKINKIIIVK